MTESQRQLRADLALCGFQLMLGVLIASCIGLIIYAVAPGVFQGDGERLTGDDFGIPAYVSGRDADGDGIDDQTDILQSAKDYVATNPMYESRYFQGGWLDDGTGVCTDIIAYALLGAGYDLREMVDDDIRELAADYTSSLAYDVDRPDPNIDYRRVSNLKVFFYHKAINLTCDTTDISEWQGGDIVCYANHIAIVSDRRNADGVPYVIHNGSPWQACYEEDRLDDWGGPEFHWRWAPRG